MFTTFMQYLSTLTGNRKVVDERNQVETALLESESRLKRAEFASKSGNWEIYLDSKVVISSEGARRLYGIKEERLDYETIKIIPLPEYRLALDNAMKNLIENDVPYDVEFEIKDPESGQIKDIHSVAQYDKKNRILFGVIQDITDRKKAESELLESEEKIRMIIEGTSYLFFYTQDTNANITYVSPSVEKITGHTVNEWITQKHWYTTDSEINRYAREKTHAHLRGEITTETILLEITHANGHNIWLEVYENPVFKNNKVVGLQGIAHDITNRKRAEDDLKSNEAFLNHLLAIIPIPVFYKDINGKYLDVNNAFVSLFGYSKSQIIGKTIFDIYPPELAEQYDVKDKELYNTGGPQIYEFKFIDSSNNIHNAIFHKAIFRNSQNEPAGMICAILDITENINMLNDLVAAKDKAEEMNRLKTSIVNNMSHELRTPLIGILGFAEILESAIEDPELKNMATMIHTGGKRLSETLNLILNLSKIEAEKLSISNSVFNLSELTRKIVANYEGAVKLKGLILTTIIKDENIIVSIDERIYSQILDNLVNNAVKFTNTGSINVLLEKESKSIDGEVNDFAILKVSDTGIGLAKEDFDLIFEEYRQVSVGLSRSFQGSGLGLTITKKFVEKLGGKISVESDLGKGSVFTVVIPANAGIP